MKIKIGSTGKGEFGYFRRARNRSLLITLLLFAIPVAAFLIAWAVNRSRMNIVTVVAIVGCLPACRSLVNFIMLAMRKPMDKRLYDEIRAHQGRLDMRYEMYMTGYEKSAYIDAAAAAGRTVVAYIHDESASAEYLSEKIEKALSNAGYPADVKIMKNKKLFLERLDSMNEHLSSLKEGISFMEDPRYPGYTREDMILHTILLLCL